MDVIVDRCAALDIDKKSVMACVRTPDGNGGRSEQIRRFSGFLDGLLALRAWLCEHGVTHVAMEATSSYWLPIVRHEALCCRAA
jgi:transposase